jgi:hypothetical protein
LRDCIGALVRENFVAFGKSYCGHYLTPLSDFVSYNIPIFRLQLSI